MSRDSSWLSNPGTSVCQHHTIHNLYTIEQIGRGNQRELQDVRSLALLDQ